MREMSTPEERPPTTSTERSRKADASSYAREWMISRDGSAASHSSSPGIGGAYGSS